MASFSFSGEASWYTRTDSWEQSLWRTICKQLLSAVQLYSINTLLAVGNGSLASKSHCYVRDGQLLLYRVMLPFPGTFPMVMELYNANLSPIQL